MSGTASSRCCGRQVEVSDSGQPMPCICVRYSIEAPTQGERCPDCGADIVIPGYCGACENDEV